MRVKAHGILALVTWVLLSTLFMMPAEPLGMHCWWAKRLAVATFEYERLMKMEKGDVNTFGGGRRGAWPAPCGFSGKTVPVIREQLHASDSPPGFYVSGRSAVPQGVWLLIQSEEFPLFWAGLSQTLATVATGKQKASRIQSHDSHKVLSTTTAWSGHVVWCVSWPKG